MEVPKFMSTDSLNVDLQPQFIRVEVKGKVTQIRFDEDILIERSTVQRSTTTGWLCVTMPRVNADMIQAQQIKTEIYKTEWQRKAKLRAMEVAEEEARETRISELQERARQDAARDRGEVVEEEKKEEEYVFKPSNLTLKAQKLPIPPLNLKRKNHFKPENECMGKVNSDSSEQKNQ